MNARSQKPRTLTSMRKWIKPHAAASSKFIVNVPLRLLEGDTYAVYYVLGWNGEEAVVGASRDDALSLRIVPTLSLPRKTIAALREIQKLSKRVDDNALPDESLGGGVPTRDAHQASRVRFWLPEDQFDCERPECPGCGETFTKVKAWVTRRVVDMGDSSLRP